uniref:(northern house mosquito) hypothetical protein n=1 Tax=Culex pipiens TaxID=7175 RepID=A0A8D8B1E8_CULPI
MTNFRANKIGKSTNKVNSVVRLERVSAENGTERAGQQLAKCILQYHISDFLPLHHVRDQRVYRSERWPRCTRDYERATASAGKYAAVSGEGSDSPVGPQLQTQQRLQLGSAD